MGWWCAVVTSVLVAVLMRPTAAVAAPLTPPASILIETVTGQVLREQDADAPRPAGSLNQLMLLLLTMEQADLGALPLDVPVTVSATAASPTGVIPTRASPTGASPAPRAASSPARMRIPLRADRAYLLSDLLKAVAITGANDAAVAVAEAIAGSVPACLESMNARAERLGARATHYASIGGVKPVQSAPPDTTTARDVARLAQALVGHPAVLQWASLTGLPFDDGSILLRNANPLIGAVPGVDGLHVSADRTAANRAADYGVVVTAQRGSLRLVAVVLGAADSEMRYRTAADLLEWGFVQYERLDVVKQGERVDIPVGIVNGAVSQITPVAGQAFSLLRRRDEERDLSVRYQLPAKLAAPVERHQPIGEIIVEEHGQVVAVIPVLSPISVPASGLLSAAVGLTHP